MSSYAAQRNAPAAGTPRIARRSSFRPSDWPMYYLARIERRHMLNASRLLAPHGINHREWRLLVKTNEHGPVSVGELAENAMFERSTVSKMIDRLARRGLLKRTESPHDHRSQLISLTALGTAKLAEAEPLVRGLLQRYAAGMRSADYDTLMRLLRAFQVQVVQALEVEETIKAARRPRAPTTARKPRRRRP